MSYTPKPAQLPEPPTKSNPDLDAPPLQSSEPKAKSRVDHGVERQIAREVVKTLKKWGAPAVSVTAASLIPIVARGRQRSARSNFDRDAVALAQRLVDRRASLVPGQTRGGASVAWHYANLSRMYREAYLDLPDLSFTQLLLAHHDALLSHQQDFSEDDARLTQRVFAPFAEMLGLWSLYRPWVEKSYKILFKREYAEMERLMGPPDLYKEEEFQKLLKTDLSKVDDDNSPYKNTNLFDKAAAFLKIKSQLEEKFKQKKLKAKVVLIQNLTGLALRRVREKEAREDVARRLGMRIICKSTDDCYAALGILHSLGRPISLSSVLHFQDHIASPQPNGYQALQAAITYSGYSGSGAIVIECRILTEDMLEMNERGVVAARKNSGTLTVPENAWWNQVPKMNAQLKKILNLNEDPNDSTILQRFLSQHNAGSVSDPLYVFTPRGEIMLLPQGSTPLDFAYRIHSEMGHHALRIEVNGQSVPHGHPLRNGDIVRVHYDPDYAGPDISWLNLVATQSARARIKSKLAARARVAHQGRAYIEAALLNALDRLQRGSFKLSVTTDRLESFLRERAPAYGYPDVTKLYDDLDRPKKNELAQRLVGDLVSAELSASITAADGEALSYSLDQIRICQTCMPVPSDAIVGHETAGALGKKIFNIHVANGRCLDAIKKARLVNLAWSDETDRDELLVFTITGDDRQGLLREVLGKIHNIEEAYLYKVEASTFADRQALISLVVKADNLDRFSEIERQLGLVGGVKEIVTARPSPSQRATLVGDPLHRQLRRDLSPPPRNPYTSEEVYKRDIFFDRQELIDSILKWLQEDEPRDPMILHGQRRVGKTSLVMHLTNEYIPAYRLAHSVLVNFQDLSKFSPLNVAGLIVRAVFQDLPQSAPGRKKGEEPMEWLSRALNKAQEFYPRLLIVIDEFNVLIDIERESNSNSPVYKNLRGVMRAQRSINWLIVVQDTHFYDPGMWRGAGILFQKARKHPVLHLDKNWSRRLILEPARKVGVVPENESALIDEILNLTAGNPLLIQLICRGLVERARIENKTVSTSDDLKVVSNIVLHDGDTWFFHFNQNLIGMRKIVMAAATEALRNKDDADESEVIRLVRERAPEITANTIRDNLVNLGREGLISMLSDEEEQPLRFTIKMGLFKQYLCQKMKLDESVAEWRSSLRPARKRRLLERTNDQAGPVG